MMQPHGKAVGKGMGPQGRQHRIAWVYRRNELLIVHSSRSALSVTSTASVDCISGNVGDVRRVENKLGDFRTPTVSTRLTQDGDAILGFAGYPQIHPGYLDRPAFLHHVVR